MKALLKKVKGFLVQSMASGPAKGPKRGELMGLYLADSNGKSRCQQGTRERENGHFRQARGG